MLNELKEYLAEVNFRWTMDQNRTTDLAQFCMEFDKAQCLNMDNLINRFFKAKVRRGTQL